MVGYGQESYRIPPKVGKLAWLSGCNCLCPLINYYQWRPGVAGGTLTDASDAMTAHQPLSSAMRSNDDNDWPVHSFTWFLMIYKVFLCDDYHPMFLGVRSSAAYHGHDSMRRLTVDSKSSSEDIEMLPCIFVCLMLYVWYFKHSPVAFVFKSLDSPLYIHRQRSVLTSIEQYWQDKWLVEFNLWKLIAFFP